MDVVAKDAKEGRFDIFAIARCIDLILREGAAFSWTDSEGV